jgi:hypothetical protein
MHFFKTCTFLSVMLFVIACEKTSISPAVSDQKHTEAGVAGKPAEEAPPTAAVEKRAYVIDTAAVMRTPSSEPKIDDPAGDKKKITNWVTRLERGEQVTISKRQGDWVFIKMSGDEEGWVQSKLLLDDENVELATVLSEVRTFQRPNMVTLIPKEKLPPGTVLFVLESQNQFSKVSVGRGKSVWVMADDISKEKNEVEVAMILARARWLAGKKDPSAQALFEQARKDYGQTKLIALLNAEEASGAPADAAGGATPTPPAAQ